MVFCGGEWAKKALLIIFSLADFADLADIYVYFLDNVQRIFL